MQSSKSNPERGGEPRRPSAPSQASSQASFGLAALCDQVLPRPQRITPGTPGETYRAGLPEAMILRRARLDQAPPGPVVEEAYAPPAPSGAQGAIGGTAQWESPEAFTLTIAPDAITIAAAGDVGRLYAQGLLYQLIAVADGAPLPTGRIDDAPVLADRGYMLDVSRNRVPTRETLERLVEYLALLRFNHLELYLEHVFTYRGHEDVWRDTGRITPADVRWLDARCRERGIELVPNQNSFGHLAGWLRHPRYQHLAEAPDGFETPWGTRRNHPFSLSPVVPEVVPFLEDLYDQLLPNFTSTRFNVGLDETFDVGQGKSAERIRALAREHGPDGARGRVYLAMLQEVHRLVTARDHTMYFWGDIIQNHPELVPALPRGVVAVEWGYEADHDFSTRCGRLADAGVPFLAAPGTCLWNSVGGRYPTAEANIRAAVDAVLQHHGRGMLLTDWGDNGHLPPPELAFPAIALAGAVAWNPRSTATPGDKAVAPPQRRAVITWTIRFADGGTIAGGSPAAGSDPVVESLETLMTLDDAVNAPRIHNASLLGAALFTFDVPGHRTVLESVDPAVIEAMETRLCEAGERAAAGPAPWREAIAWAVLAGRHAAALLRRRRGLPVTAADVPDQESLRSALVGLWRAGYRDGGLSASLDVLRRADEFGARA